MIWNAWCRFVVAVVAVFVVFFASRTLWLFCWRRIDDDGVGVGMVVLESMLGCDGFEGMPGRCQRQPQLTQSSRVGDGAMML